jgi:hypothetical protein
LKSPTLDYERCYACGYDAGNAAVCPECGVDLSSVARNRWEARNWRWKPLEVALGIVGPGLLLLAMWALDFTAPRAPLWMPGWLVAVATFMPGFLLSVVAWFRVMRRRHGDAFAWSICIGAAVLHSMVGVVCIGLAVLLLMQAAALLF